MITAAETCGVIPNTSTQKGSRISPKMKLKRKVPPKRKYSLRASNPCSDDLKVKYLWKIKALVMAIMFPTILAVMYAINRGVRKKLKNQ